MSSKNDVMLALQDCQQRATDKLNAVSDRIVLKKSCLFLFKKWS